MSDAAEAAVYLTAAAAAELLGITLATLYAYVSRGLLASEAVPGAPRQRRYRREEVERLRDRRDLRRHPEEAAPRALAFGEPVLESALTLIDGERLYYRGRDAVALARERSFEEVAALLWTGDAASAATLFSTERAPFDVAAAGGSRADRTLLPVERLQALLPAAGARDPAAWDFRPEAVARCGARILAAATAAIAGHPPRRAGIAATLAARWRPRAGGSAGAARAISAALVLTADHELNVSTFAARCAASAAATPWDCVAAGLAALKGRRHGGEAFRLAALLRDAEQMGAEQVGAEAAIAAWLRRGESLPGFGHRLYPGGDPRAAELLRLARASRAGKPLPVKALNRVEALATAGRKLTGELPNLDLGLAALVAAFGLPHGSALSLFALGRTAGWVAHAIEEYGRGTLIRPRARYVGALPPAR